MKCLKMLLVAMASFALFSLGLLCLGLLRLEEQIQLTAQELHKTAEAATSLTLEAHGRLVGTSQNLNAILLQAGLASDEVRRASMEQRKYWNQAGAQTVQLLGAASSAVDGLNTATHDLDNSIGKITDSTVLAMDAIPPTLKALQQPLEASTRTLNDASLILESPTIAATMANVQHTTETIDHSTKTIDTFLTRITKPASVVKTVLWKLLGLAPETAVALK